MAYLSVYVWTSLQISSASLSLGSISKFWFGGVGFEWMFPSLENVP